MRNLLGLKSWNRPLGFMAMPPPAPPPAPPGPLLRPTRRAPSLRRFQGPPPPRPACHRSSWAVARADPEEVPTRGTEWPEHVRARSRGPAGSAAGVGVRVRARAQPARPGGPGRRGVYVCGPASAPPPAFIPYPSGKRLLRVAPEAKGPGAPLTPRPAGRLTSGGRFLAAPAEGRREPWSTPSCLLHLSPAQRSPSCSSCLSFRSPPVPCSPSAMGMESRC
ncbi:basic proline-rich protein-like isoform X2 [Lutra lutra]|uniref:basic proline-rich protein-like isoform X2 n=1 Tax=Lutra lutra TaxID=9657 RepID=UPI001FD57C74|nr:basic proline-rich protein-like isoform X2 [Lutra lutra]XP_047578571.1 basic proline-rich protein-like isoform X2 [Lutra lutra]